ncbi:MAG: LruC domain-containing protein [Bacteroidia bacterium]|nr:LruC domain-containing protein [Bacteroidia bacterium]MCF8425862.1 LruC domain-containing protein [Bacteroidia bacterium]MCF8445641.1 LruC domain-containing protein [Bacteroidia bacterium]
MKKLAVLILIFITLESCKKLSNTSVEEPTPSDNVTDMNQLVVPKGFNYKTSDEVEFSITLLNNNDEPLKHVRIDIMSAAPEDGGIIYTTGATNNQGKLVLKKELPLTVKEVVLNTDYIGLPNNVLLSIQAHSAAITLGGKLPQKIRTINENKYSGQATLGKSTSQYSYRLGSYNSSGVPNYLITPNDVISSTFLDDVNASLPERQPVPTYKPQYLSSSVERNLIIKELCDVWITFVHEGAGYQNSLFYFVYNVNNKPTSISEVDSFIAVFPNASYSGSGGGMTTGNKVKIGRFGADTAVGFAIAANGWNGTSVGNGLGFYTTIKSMNPEVDVNKKEHVVLLYDNPTQRFLIGFEDLNRGNGSDDDFNDVVVYATVNPVKAIEIINVLPTTPSVDADEDGVNDAYDEYPTDPLRAFNVYYPSSTTMASVAFEDLWPSKGDYDLNDVVVDFQYHAVTNGNNEIKDLNAKFKLRAAGGVFKNAFSVEFPFNRTNVTTNSGSTTLGLEAEATTAILKVFSNSKSIISTYNTLEGKGYVETDTLFTRMTLTTPVLATIGTFNPFIYIDESGKGRGFEVHLPGKTPTSLVNTAILGTNSDATNAGTGVYYKTSAGLPFAISTPEKFDYPYEKIQIIAAHKKFAAWVQSGGASFDDWYKNLSEYRDNTKIYSKP